MEEEDTIRLNDEKDVPDKLDNMEVQVYPRKVTEFIIKKPKGFFENIKDKLMFWRTPQIKKIINPELKQPIILFMKENGYIDIIEGAKSGLFIYQNKETGKRKGIILSPKKLNTLNIEPFPKCWIAYENEVSPYPTDVFMDAEDLEGIVRKIETNKGLLKDQASIISAKMWFWVAILGVLGIILYFGVKGGWFNGLFG